MKKFTLTRTLRDIVILNRIIKPLKTIKTVAFDLNRKLTKFDIGAIAYRLRSKKARSDTINVREGGMQFYRYAGKVIKFRKTHDPINSSVALRNTLERTPFEISVPIFSPLVTNDNYAANPRKARRNAYFLRNAAPAKSKIPFNYANDD